MNLVFADSFYWLAILDPRDPDHARAVAFHRSVPLLTTIPVLIEVMDALCGVAARKATAQFWRECWSDSRLEIAPLSEDLLNRAVALFAARPDKAWSLTDCISFTIMQDRGIRLALTGDKHFLQAGFEIAFP